jgi:hypothetical protein
MSNLRLFINDDEYDFDGLVSFSYHPTNFSKMIFNEVIKKSDNVYPNNLKNISISREFSVARVYDNNDLIFLGIVNSTGRLSLLPNKLKSRSIEITDMRKLLSLLKPVNKVFFNVTPNTIINELVAGLNEP